MKSAAERSLSRFASLQYATIVNGIGRGTLLAFWSYLRLRDGKKAPFVPKAFTKEKARSYIDADSTLYNLGTPGNEYGKTFVREKVVPTLERMVQQYAEDPDDISERRRNSLRSRAEMEVRYQGHIDEVDSLRASGTKLVIASTHGDCSDRCRPWQGRVYSLDGTSGTTDDGRRYVPLEQATDIYYTTKAGKTYKNGLLGFNCRHYLIPYKSGYRFPHVSADVAKKQYQITQRQREMERRVRAYTIKANAFRKIDHAIARKADQKARMWRDAHRAYSLAHHHAWDEHRTKLI